MNARTVGVLAALGMLVTSISVWSFTKPKHGLPQAETETGVAEPGADPGSVPGSALSSFSAGNVLRLDGRLGHARLLADAPGETYVFAEVAADGRDAATAAPLNLAIVVDRSGSMKGKRLANALDAARGMIRRLRDGDVLSVIAYDTRTETIVPATTLDGFSRDRALASLSSIVAGGDTCISCGLDAAMAALRSRSGMVMRTLLLSDGEATAGVKDLDGFRRIAASARSMGCPISSIGVDLDYNERVLSTLARESNGQHYFAETNADLQNAFDRELRSLVRTVANDAEIQLDLAPGVEVVEVVDRSFRRDGQKLFVRMGTFSAGDKKTLLVKVRVPKGSPGETEVARLSLAFTDPTSGRKLDVGGKLETELVTSGAQQEVDPQVAARLGRTETADAIEEANQLFESGDVAAANDRLEQARRGVAQTRTQALAHASPATSGALDGDFERQSGELEDAKKRFKAKPASPAGKAGTKRNQEKLDPFRF
jgi:Ca-activated chloride channel homolog